MVLQNMNMKYNFILHRRYVQYVCLVVICKWSGLHISVCGYSYIVILRYVCNEITG